MAVLIKNIIWHMCNSIMQLQEESSACAKTQSNSEHSSVLGVVIVIYALKFLTISSSVSTDAGSLSGYSFMSASTLLTSASEALLFSPAQQQ